jgi:LysR family nod box-dependent transcriptional activator
MGPTSADDRNLRLSNLNLLPILRAVLKHRNLTRAAAELHVTQAAVSNSLRQLRAHFGDALLVRDGRSLRLTEKAKQLVEPLEAALGAIQGVLANSGFDPARSNRRFRIATADYVTAIVAPKIAALLAQEAPQMSVQIVTARGNSANDLRAGNIDMVIAPRQIIQSVAYNFPNLAKELTLEDLASEPLVCVAHESDKAFARGLSSEEYLARPHATFHLDLNIHANLEHGYLIEHSLVQFNRILISEFSLLPLIVSQSDCIALVPLSVARLMQRTLHLQIGAPPLPMPRMELVMVWKRQRAKDPELSWLRQLVARCIGQSILDAADPTATPQKRKRAGKSHNVKAREARSHGAR